MEDTFWCKNITPTCEEDHVSELRVLSLELQQTVQVRRADVQHVAAVVREDFHHLPLLVGRQQFQQVSSVSAKPEDQTKTRLRISTCSRSSSSSALTSQ